MKLMKNTKGFTLVEIMIVVAIIGLLAAIAVPNFMQAKANARKGICINNLRLIYSAQQQWALDNSQDDTAAVAAGNVDDYMKGGTMLTCPTAGGVYTLTTVSANPTCAVAGHVLVP